MAVNLDFTPTRIKQIRERLRMTQQAFAERLGVSNTAVSMWESGQRGQRRPVGGRVLARLLELEREADAQPDGAGEAS